MTKYIATFSCFDHKGKEIFEVEEGKEPRAEITRQVQKKGCKTGIVLSVTPIEDDNTTRKGSDGC